MEPELLMEQVYSYTNNMKTTIKMKPLFKFLLLFVVMLGTAGIASAQKKRAVKKRASTNKTTKAKTQANVQPTAPTPDTVVVAAPVNDSLPIKTVLRSLRNDFGYSYDSSLNDVTNRISLPYEHLRKDDAVFTQRIWREIDTREKINKSFNYDSDEDNGNQRFISILMKAIQDSAVTAFSSTDDRFTTPMTKGEVASKIGGDPIEVPIYDENGVQTGSKTMTPEVNLDSFYRFRIKEEVIFDKESSRLFWRIIGIAPVKDVITSMGVNLGSSELFWVYYPDMRPVFSQYSVYNSKNYGARMSWEELFESRMFHGRIIKSTMDNPGNRFIKDYKGLSDNTMLQLFEGEDVTEKIFNYEQNLWEY